ncbi:hypothetical protein ACFFTM_05615 [Pseudoduganella plicata]|uniref:Lipoprotein n=1 Tax=Pseudoduganella plicata TaxID=321984 RepID=A0A4P7BK00_9BURK|nr:hypothetical protein [Pseudoduganella plicata]QBQ38663.1 hypothetical protein E1742_22680 [Pseudoduganella plicata]GGY84044.1 hypothetical protein GCM10007388_16380 [Pseudoduganella plicata]
MKKISLLLIIACAVLAGCASAPSAVPAIDGADISTIKSERIAVNYKVVSKQVNYIETLYRVLWLETKTSRQDFSGLWSADEDMTRYAVEALRAQGFNADSVHGAIPAPQLTAANSFLIGRAQADAQISHPEIAGTKLLPIPLYFGTWPKDAALETATGALRQKGYRYLVDMTAMDLYGNAAGYGMVIVTAQPNVRVVDLTTGKVVWNSNLNHMEVFQLGGDLKKLEENDLAKLKEGMKAGIAKLNFQALWGVK